MRAALKSLLMTYIVAVMLAGMVKFSAGVTSAMAHGSIPVKQGEPPQPECTGACLEDDTILPYAEYVNSLQFLTDAEKAQLLDTDRAVAPYLAQIDELVWQSDAIKDNIMRDYRDVASQIDAIYAQVEPVWQKVDAYLDAQVSEDKSIDYDSVQHINPLSCLSEAERSALWEAEKQLHLLEAQYKVGLEKAAAATAELSAQIDKLYQEIDALQAKDAPIWEKILGHEP